jgi:hypothetical protein
MRTSIDPLMALQTAFRRAGIRLHHVCEQDFTANARVLAKP